MLELRSFADDASLFARTADKQSGAVGHELLISNDIKDCKPGRILVTLLPCKESVGGIFATTVGLSAARIQKSKKKTSCASCRPYKVDVAKLAEKCLVPD